MLHTAALAAVFLLFSTVSAGKFIVLQLDNPIKTEQYKGICEDNGCQPAIISVENEKDAFKALEEDGAAWIGGYYSGKVLIQQPYLIFQDDKGVPKVRNIMSARDKERTNLFPLCYVPGDQDDLLNSQKGKKNVSKAKTTHKKKLISAEKKVSKKIKEDEDEDEDESEGEKKKKGHSRKLISEKKKKSDKHKGSKKTKDGYPKEKVAKKSGKKDKKNKKKYRRVKGKKVSITDGSSSSSSSSRSGSRNSSDSYSSSYEESDD